MLLKNRRASEGGGIQLTVIHAVERKKSLNGSFVNNGREKESGGIFVKIII